MNEKRILYYDILNIAACIAVITLHHNGLVHTFSETQLWRECLLAEVCFFWAVPVFLMLSGATLMDYRKKYSTKTFFKKRLMRVGLPWLFWSIVLLLYKCIRGTYILEIGDWRAVLDAVVNCKIEPIYWFFPVIIGIYMFMPILSFWADSKYKKILWYAISWSIIANGTMPILIDLFKLPYNTAFESPFSGYYVFVILGYLLSTTEIKKEVRKLIYCLGIACAVIRYVGIYYLSMRDGVKNTLLFDYGQFHSFFLAMAIFVFVKYVKWDHIINPKIQRGITRFAGCSLGIYLIHIPIMNLELKWFNVWEGDFAWRTVFVLVTYIICLAIVWGGGKTIPGVRKLFP